MWHRADVSQPVKSHKSIYHRQRHHAGRKIWRSGWCCCGNHCYLFDVSPSSCHDRTREEAATLFSFFSFLEVCHRGRHRLPWQHFFCLVSIDAKQTCPKIPNKSSLTAVIQCYHWSCGWLKDQCDMIGEVGRAVSEAYDLNWNTQFLSVYSSDNLRWPAVAIGATGQVTGIIRVFPFCGCCPSVFSPLVVVFI